MNAIRAQNSQIQKLIRESYTPRQLEQIQDLVRPALEIHVNARGIVHAADRRLTTEYDPTHYDAVWLRDSVWVSFALDPERSVQVLGAMLSYLGSPAQVNRLIDAVHNPESLLGPEGAMKVPHIRFDGSSETFDDVMEHGQPQKWNHKQNDALGLFLLATFKQIQSGLLPIETLSFEQMRPLVLLPTYLEKARFFEMEDAGAWEEIERLNTSSVALVTSALEKFEECLADSEFLAKFEETAWHYDLPECTRILEQGRLRHLIESGYKTIRAQLPRGESPGYPPESPKYREADAALLNLVYPCELKELSVQEKLEALEHIRPLIGEVGIKRYLGDAYQCEGYWSNKSSSRDPETDARTADFSRMEDFVLRTQMLRPGTEAQWFFDSWLSHIYGELYRSTKNPEFLHLQTLFLNRSLGQITGGSLDAPVKAADGSEVFSFAIPESYNVFEGGFAPSPITPLNWAKATLKIALDSLQSNLKS